MKKLLFALASFAAAWSAQAAVETFTIDPAHSSVSFRIRHFFTPVPGQFTQFQGAISVDRDDMEKNSAEATINVASVDTRQEKRDTHLKSPDFFDVQKFPSMSFKSKSWRKTGTDTYDVTGDLTIKDVTKEVVLKTKSLGFGPGMKPGSQMSGWEATTTINRKEFGMNLKPMLEKMLGEDVEVTINVEASTAPAGGAAK